MNWICEKKKMVHSIGTRTKQAIQDTSIIDLMYDPVGSRVDMWYRYNKRGDLDH